MSVPTAATNAKTSSVCSAVAPVTGASFIDRSNNKSPLSAIDRCNRMIRWQSGYRCRPGHRLAVEVNLTKRRSRDDVFVIGAEDLLSAPSETAAPDPATRPLGPVAGEPDSPL